jgi:hypothetical protein
LVDHCSSIVSAQGICDKLNEQGFGASIELDHAALVGEMSSFVVSIFSVNSTDAGSIEELKGFLASLPTQQIERFEFNDKSNQLTVIHNPLFVTATDLAAAIETKTCIATVVKVDGDEGKVWEFFEQIGQEEASTSTKSQYLRPTVMLSGIFWIVSMLSYISGNW